MRDVSADDCVVGEGMKDLCIKVLVWAATIPVAVFVLTTLWKALMLLQLWMFPA